MHIGQKFVVEHFIFVVTFAQILEKQAHDEFRSQFAFFCNSAHLCNSIWTKQEQNT